MDDLDPEKLWEDKGADYIAPYDEVLERVARWIESDLQELWNRNTTLKHHGFLPGMQACGRVRNTKRR